LGHQRHGGSGLTIGTASQKSNPHKRRRKSRRRVTPKKVWGQRPVSNGVS